MGMVVIGWTGFAFCVSLLAGALLHVEMSRGKKHTEGVRDEKKKGGDGTERMCVRTQRMDEWVCSRMCTKVIHIHVAMLWLPEVAQTALQT